MCAFFLSACRANQRGRLKAEILAEAKRISAYATISVQPKNFRLRGNDGTGCF
jgi:hypothetical protein